ncbi:MAG: tetratricopeptide repeat protein [Gemmataceae bacterium]
MPTIHKPFLLKLIIAVLAFAGLLVGGHTLQARRIPEGLLRQSERANDAGKTDRAIHYLRHYLEFEPEDANALEKLADLLRRRDPTYRGYTDFVFISEKVLRIDADRHDVRREVLASCLKMGRYSDAVIHAEYLLERFPNDAGLWQQLGAAQSALNQLADARTAFETALKHSPDDLAAYQRLAQLMWKSQNRPAEARQVLDRMVKAMPMDPLAYYTRAKFESYLADESLQRGQAASLESAKSDLHRVLELDPENADASLLLAEICQKNRDVPGAHAILRDAAGLYPKDIRLIRSLAWLELIRGNVPAALAALEEGLKYSPDGFDLLVPLTDLLVQQGDAVRSNEILERLKARKAPEAQVKYLQARVLMRDKKWTDAIAMLETLRTDTLKLPTLEAQLNLLLAMCFERIADPDSQEKALKRITSTDPNNVNGRVALATLYQNMGRFDDAIREFDAAAQSPFAAGSVHASLIRQKIAKFRLTGASVGEWAKLEQTAAAAAAKFGPVSSEAIVLRAEVFAAQEKHTDAIRLLRAEAARRPGDTRLWASLAHTTAAAMGTAAGLIVMDEAQAAAGDGAEIRLARAALYAREPGRFRPVAPLADAIDTWAEADQMRLLYGLAELFEQVDDKPRFVATLRRLVAHRPKDVDLWQRLYAAALDAGDGTIAPEARVAILRLAGDDTPDVILSNAATRNDPQMMATLIAAFTSNPISSDACLAIAKCKFAANDVPEALRLTERAAILEPTRFEPARAGVVLLCSTGAEERAMRYVAKLAADPRWAGDPFRRLVQSCIESLPPETGARIVAMCKPFVERDAAGRGWLAAALTTVGRRADAEAVLESAVKLPMATADDWFRLALSTSAVDETMKAAKERLLPQVWFSLAAAFQETATGKNWKPVFTDAADKRAFAQARLAAKLSRSARGEAASVLDEFLAEKDLSAADAGWARRNLAMILAIGGTADDRTRAMSLLKQSEDDGATPDDLRATAGVLTNLAKYLDGEDRKAVLTRAAAALETVYAASQSPKDLFNLAQLHRVAGNRKASREKLNALLRTDAQNMYYLTAALEELTEDRNLAAGAAFAERLTSKFAGEFRAVAAVCRFECRAGRAERALALAEGYAGAADSAAGDYLARAARTAELLDELVRSAEVRNTEAAKKMIAAALERYAALVPTRPEAIVGIAGLLGADGRIAEAIEQVDRHSRFLPVRVKALAGLAALRSGGATERQYSQVRVWLDDALRGDPASVPLMLNDAEFRTLQNDYAGAAAVYESVLKREPRNVVALNNLAWIHAADPTAASKSLDLLERAVREAGLTGELLDTRARARITLKQLAAADRDLAEAMTQEATALRWFHRSILRQAEGEREEAVAAFREAVKRGLDVKRIHPADLPAYRVLEADGRRSSR